MKKRTAVMLIALVAVIGIAAGGTLAYLTSQETVTNTFTVGDVDVTLDEAKVDAYGVVLTGEEAARVKANEYKLIPGHKYAKDPTVHVQPGSEASYIFIRVDNGIADIEAPTVEGGYQNIAAQIADNRWTALTGVDGVYYKQVNANTGTTAVDYQVFGEFAIDEDVRHPKPDPAEEGVFYLADYADAEIVVTAYVIQAEGFDTAADAWTAGWQGGWS
ncbi:MAG: SipW-dependent-type signal peptide-containing protein [Clostridia bacterium]|nr:SipW-dependent-type signal peptide-containing protein [Clostridia bacterium]